MQRAFASLLCLLGLSLPALATTPPHDTAANHLSVPLQYYRLDNGLRVVLAQDRSIPTVTVGTYYHIGFRIEPRTRTGFAHLFEHLMFQETPGLARGEADRVIAGNGGLGNGSTRFDYTNYYEVVPSNVLESALFVEASRMRGLVVSEKSIQNQKDVVKNEVRVNVLNRPYGGFPWLDLPQVANQNWFNAHNFYGELDEIDAATLDDVRAFYETYYVPSNAVLVVAGDFDADQVHRWIEQYYAALPRSPAPNRPDLAEPAQTQARESSRVDPLAPRPALAFGYHLPARQSDDWYAFCLLNVVLAEGEDSRLAQALVQKHGYTDGIEGGMNLLGGPFDYEGPMLWWSSLVHDPAVTDAQILQVVDAVLDDVRQHPVSAAELRRARTKVRSGLYDVIGSPTRFGLVETLASFALFDDDPTAINRIEARLAAITPAQISQVASRYLQPTQRSVVHLQSSTQEGK